MTMHERTARLIGSIVGHDTAASLATRLAADSIGTYLLRVVSAALSLVISMGLARMLAVDGYGTYTYVIAWASSLHVLTACGLDRLLVRNVASYLVRSEWSYLRGLLKWTTRAAFWISLIATAVAGYIASRFFHKNDATLLPAFWCGMLLVPFLTLNILRQAAMQGMHQVIPGQLPDRIIQPVLIAAFVGCAYWLNGKTMQPLGAVILTGAGMLITCGFGIILFFRALPTEVKHARASVVRPEWKTSAYPLALVSWATIATDQADTLLLGLLGGVDDVGIYSVGIRGVRVISFSLIAVNTAMAPATARLFATGDIPRLRRLAVRSSRTVLLIALPLAAGLVLLRHFYLGLFGSAFAKGEHVLLILVIGQLINAAAGPGSLLLIASGHERDVAVATALSSVVQVAFCVILIPSLGVIGAAISRVSTIASLNIVFALLVYRRLRFSCFAFATCPPASK